MADLATSRTSGYPTAIDTQSAEEKDEGGAGATAARSQPVQACVDAIIKLQTELGANPSGTFATVAARLDATLISWLQAEDLVLSISGTTVIRVAASAASPRRAPIVNGEARVVAANTDSAALSGTAGARWVWSQMTAGVSTFALIVTDTSAPPDSDHGFVGVSYWDGAAIKHVWTVGRSSADYGIALTQANTTSSTYVDSGASITIAANGIDPVTVAVLDAAYVDGDSSGFTGLVVDGTIVAEGHAGETGVDGHRSTISLLRVLSLSAGAHTIKIQIRRIEGAGTFSSGQGGGRLWASQCG